MRYLALFLHIYQPPTQTPEILKQVTQEAYTKIIDTLNQSKKGKITLNINACLTEMLEENGYKEVVESLSHLGREGKIEFVSSGKYHPILPLIPEEEILRQIQLNNLTNKKLIGSVYSPKGFFPPEMCISEKLLEILNDRGFTYVIGDEISTGEFADFRKYIYKVKGLNLSLFVRNRHLSDSIASPDIMGLKDIKEVIDSIPDNSYAIIASDGEFYGHHHKGKEKLLSEFLNTGEFTQVTISELSGIFKEQKEIPICSSSWSSFPEDFSLGASWRHWFDPTNKIHKLQWELTYGVINYFRNISLNQEGFQEGRNKLDKALHSCQYWWASERPWWSKDMIFKGLDLYKEAVEAMKQDSEEKQKLLNLVLYIKDTVNKYEKEGSVNQIRESFYKLHPEFIRDAFIEKEEK